MRSIRTICELFTLSSTCVFICGCAAFTDYEFSKPESETQNIEISSIGRMLIDDAVFFISSTNYLPIASGTIWLDVFRDGRSIAHPSFSSYYYNACHSELPGFFIIELFVAVGGTPINLYPTDIVLKYRNNEWRPTNTYNLAKAYGSTNALWGHRAYFPLCGAPELKYKYSRNPLFEYKNGGEEKRQGRLENHMVLEREKSYCIALEFGISPPGPQEEFRLSVPLKIGDSTTPITIKFSPNTIEDRHQ